MRELEQRQRDKEKYDEVWCSWWLGRTGRQGVLALCSSYSGGREGRITVDGSSSWGWDIGNGGGRKSKVQRRKGGQTERKREGVILSESVHRTGLLSCTLEKSSLLNTRNSVITGNTIGLKSKTPLTKQFKSRKWRTKKRNKGDDKLKQEITKNVQTQELDVTNS